MEILHICTQAPGKTSGGEIGILQFSYALSKIADRVDYVGPQIKDPEIAGMYNKAEYLENTLTPMQKVWSLLHFQFDRKYISWKKKSIDLEYGVWLRLSKYSRKMKMTLSETITYMIDERESKALYESQMTAMKAGLKNLLNK